MRPTMHVGLLNINPVIRQKLRSLRRLFVDLEFFQQHANRNEVAINQSFADFHDIGRNGRIEARISSLIGMVEKK